MPKLLLPFFIFLMRGLVVLPIRLYQYCISPLLPPACRFYPSCSNYALQAILLYGVVRGGWLSLCRLARCHPWSPGGYDPVPPVLPSRPTDVCIKLQTQGLHPDMGGQASKNTRAPFCMQIGIRSS